MTLVRSLTLCTLAVALAACRNDAPQALGTLEYDRITLPAPAAEKIVVVGVREGQSVKAGQSLLQLELDRTRAATEASKAQAARSRASLAELEAGPRSESIAAWIEPVSSRSICTRRDLPGPRMCS